MNVLLLPKPDKVEGPTGYRMRVAEANLLPFSLLARESLDSEHDDADVALIFQRWRDLRSGPAIWVNRRARWCPVCLAEHDRGRIGWELLFADACAGCGHWLLDACGVCGDPVTWRRDAIARCGCGANLCEQPSRMAPDAVVRLSRTMEQLALGVPGCELPHLQRLSVAQCSRLVRVLGAYGSARHQRTPQKIVGADTLDVSWAISTVAAEILVNWPAGFHDFLARQEASASAKSGRMSGVFGGFYRALYKGLKDPEFDWVRQAFEDFIAENWAGAMGKRNRRMPAAVVARLAWLPAVEAAAQLGISNRRLAYLIEAGRVTVSRRMTATGRQFVMVRRADIQVLAQDMVDELTLVETATMLGIKRQRLSRLLPTLCPEATKVTLQGTPWLIPRSWVDRWLQRLDDLPVVHEALADAVSLDYLLRYGPLDDQAMAEVLNDIAADRIQPLGKLDRCRGIAGLLVDRRQVIDACHRSGHDGLSAPLTAERLGVKQEVAYALIRAGLLVAEQRCHGRRTAAVVSDASIDLFNATYIFATELARSLGRSPRAVVQALAEEKVEPVAGPSLGNCRQVVYARRDLAAVGWLELSPNTRATNCHVAPNR